MCLITNQTRPQVADKDIICYKVIKKNMHSLYHDDFTWQFGKVYHTEMKYSVLTGVENGFHSYSLLEDITREYTATSTPCIIVECTIPTGAEYYYGTQLRGAGYTSNKLVINRVVDTKEAFPDFDFEKFPFKVGQKIRLDDSEGFIENIQPYHPHKCVYVLTNIPDQGTSGCQYFAVSRDGKLRRDRHNPKITIITE